MLKKNTPMIEIPDTSKGQRAMVRVNKVWYAIYYVGVDQRRKSLGTTDEKEAKDLRDAFFRELLQKGANPYVKRTPQKKVLDKPDLYIYTRPPYQFKVKGKVIFESWDKEEVRKVRDKWLKKNK